MNTIINNFSLTIATVNGTGSQTANLAILRTLFKMGIPVNGKNIFPSNIQGMPTWYHIRVSKDGYVARSETTEILLAFNPATAQQDVQTLVSGGICLYNADWAHPPARDDVTFYPIPVKKFVAASGLKGKVRDYAANMVYVGALAQLLNIPLANIDAAIDHHFGGRVKAAETNKSIIHAAYEWTAVSITTPSPYSIAPMDKTDDMILISGNEAAALGAIYGGVTFISWYPITPSTGIIDGLNAHLPRLRTDPDTGKATYAVVQAEDELAAAGMIVGAGWAGARAMTATSGPGISLMAEFVGLAHFAEVPAVIWNVQRVGPSTGLPTKTGQGDVTFTYHLGHGDGKQVLLFPASVAECFDFGWMALDLADQLQTPIFVMSDLDLGMNNWMSPTFSYPSTPIQRGKVLSAAEVTQGYARYKDIDGDGIPYRTLPGNENPLAAWFARGTGHNEKAVYSERPLDWTNNMARLQLKFDTARTLVPAPVVEMVEGAAFGIIAYGTTQYAIDEARATWAKQGVKCSFLRLRALPITPDVEAFVQAHEYVLVIELNRDGQMHAILQHEMPAIATKLRSWAQLDGLPLTAQQVMEIS